MIPQLPGGVTDTLVGLVLAAVAVNALSAYLAYGIERPIGSSVDERARTGGYGRPVGVTDGELTVDCPECGAENEAGYRYCRECVAELPGAVGFERTGSGPDGRLVG